MEICYRYHNSLVFPFVNTQSPSFPKTWGGWFFIVETCIRRPVKGDQRSRQFTWNNGKKNLTAANQAESMKDQPPTMIIPVVILFDGYAQENRFTDSRSSGGHNLLAAACPGLRGGRGIRRWMRPVQSSSAFSRTCTDIEPGTGSCDTTYR
jgi:hypothetical protein